MRNFDIYVDSGTNIPQSILKEREIHEIPFLFSIDGREQSAVEEGVSFEETAKAFYQKMREGAEIKTSLLTAHTFSEALTPTLKAGRDAILITISSGISGTFHQAQEAARALEEQFPGRRVFALDSANASMGSGLLAIRAADLRDLGESAETAAAWVRENAYRMNSYLTVGDLKYLKRTGRISATLAIAGTILNIKPVLRADGGANAKIVFFAKERGRKKALAALAEAYRERAIEPENQTVAICHCDCEEDALSLAEMIKEIGAKDVIVEYYDLTTGSHVGPGTVALFFYGKDRRGVFSPSEERQPIGATVPNRI